jgi:RNA polymerase sigma factor (sigma-70 family)
MSELSEAEGYLLEQVRVGDAEGWRSLVTRYQGRLVAFARNKIRQAADAEDLVQDTFIGLLKGLPNFRGEASLETYLFTILRHKIINSTRGRRTDFRLLEDALPGTGHADPPRGRGHAVDDLAAPDPTASWYVRRDETREGQRRALTRALTALIDRLKESENFRDLQVVEMLFFRQMPNKEAAGLLTLDEKHVALIKHRALRQVRESVARFLSPGATDQEPSIDSGIDESTPVDPMITEVWQELRLSCPKRSTIGGYVLGTLEPPWQGYVAFHLDRLGCEFCRANLDDLRRASADNTSHALRQRIMESTVGFLSRP